MRVVEIAGAGTPATGRVFAACHAGKKVIDHFLSSKGGSRKRCNSKHQESTNLKTFGKLSSSGGGVVSPMVKLGAEDVYFFHQGFSSFFLRSNSASSAEFQAKQKYDSQKSFF